MKVKAEAVPFFSSALLSSVHALLSRRRKPLRYRGRFDMEAGADREGEWLRVVFRNPTGPYVVVEVLSDQLVNVYLQDARKPRRGKVLFHLDNIRVSAGAPRIVDAIICTLKEADYSAASHAAVERRWRGLSFELLRGSL